MGFDERDARAILVFVVLAIFLGGIFAVILQAIIWGILIGIAILVLLFLFEHLQGGGNAL